MMYNGIKIGILGGDLRQLALARALAKNGYETAIWGIDSADEAFGSAVRCATVKDAVGGARAVILPLPVTRDGTHVSSPLSAAEPVPLSRLLSFIPKGTLLLGGNMPPALVRAAEERGIRTADYFAGEVLKIKNAQPTAEGAVAIAMHEMMCTVKDCRAAVLGYGRIGRALAPMLRALGARVCVFARNPNDRAWAEVEGADAIPFSELSNKIGAFDVIFNTAPSRVISSEMLDTLRSDTVLIDLAAAPGGADEAEAASRGIRYIRALSLPGRMSPYTAGKIIAESVLEILHRDEEHMG